MDRKRKREEPISEAIQRLKDAPIMTAIAIAAKDGGYLHRVFSGDRTYATYHGLIGAQYGGGPMRGQMMRDAQRVMWGGEREIYERLGKKEASYREFPADNRPGFRPRFQSNIYEDKRKNIRRPGNHVQGDGIRLIVNGRQAASNAEEYEKEIKKYQITDEDIARANAGKPLKAEWYERL